MPSRRNTRYTSTVSEMVIFMVKPSFWTADEQALAREIAHENPLIPASGKTHTIRLLKQSDIFGH